MGREEKVRFGSVAAGSGLMAEDSRNLVDVKDLIHQARRSGGTLKKLLAKQHTHNKILGIVGCRFMPGDGDQFV